MSASTWPPERAAADSTQPRVGGAVDAAVLVPLHGEGIDQRLVLTRRRSDLRRHAGEISFPGGRRDPEDRDLQDTALREAEEEIGLPRADVRIVAQLQATSTFATGYVIHPYVGLIPSGLPWTPSPQEVDEVLELPLGEVRSSRTRVTLQRRGIDFETDAYALEGNVIWGATARIIQLLLEHIDAGAAAGAGSA
ncbi:MAG TPA: CoA pyrophosphatase [Solirubrobacteraceae bacterium]